MKWPRWSLATTEAGDFLPTLVGCVFLCTSLPGFVMLLFNADRGSGAIALPLLIVLGAGALLGFGFVVFGIRICAYPGSLAYRLTHVRIFSR